MKTILLAVAALFTGITFSQITITSSDFADSGDTVRLSVANDPQIDFATTGPDQIWDYSYLVPTSQSLKEYNDISQAGTFAGLLFGQFAAPKYQASYFNETTALPLGQVGQFLPFQIESINQVTRIATDSVTTIGAILSVSGNLIPVKADTIETRYALPLHFGDTHFSRGHIHLDMNPIQNAIWIQHRTRSTEVDGYGTITTPFGNFSALRVKHDITENDSIFIELSGFPIWLPIPVPASTEYEWWTNGEKEPVLKITTNSIQGNETVMKVEYRDIYRGLDAGLTENQITCSVFPNPSKGHFQVVSEAPIQQVIIYSLDGKSVMVTPVSNAMFFSVDLSSQPKGVFVMEVVSEKGTFRTRVIRD